MGLENCINTDRMVCFWGKLCWLYSNKMFGGFCGNISSWMQWNWHCRYKDSCFFKCNFERFCFLLWFWFFGGFFEQRIKMSLRRSVLNSRVKFKTFHLILLCSFPQLWSGNNTVSLFLKFGLHCPKNDLTDPQGRGPFFTVSAFVNVELWTIRT